MASLTIVDRQVPIDPRPLVVHVMYRFDTGGLENGIVNLINAMDHKAYRHAVLALTEITDFRRRVLRDDVEFIALNKPPGHGFWLYPRLYRLFRRLRPAIVHTRNLGAMEVVVPAWAAGVPVRIHGEHGREISDLDGSNRTHQLLRRFYRPFVTHFFALSRDLADYLRTKVGVPEDCLTQVFNGVDPERFRPAADGDLGVSDCPFDSRQHWIIGTVGRMQPVKDQVNLAKAFVLALKSQPQLQAHVRLVMVGAGPLRDTCKTILRDAGLDDLAWLPGERTDIPAVLRSLHVFVLPSLAEGISNTILEAMATGLPVVATAVGGNADLVEEGKTGWIVPPSSPQALADALVRLAINPFLAHEMGQAGRAAVLRRFSMQAMINNYRGRYDAALGISRPKQQA